MEVTILNKCRNMSRVVIKLWDVKYVKKIIFIIKLKLLILVVPSENGVSLKIKIIAPNLYC